MLADAPTPNGVWPSAGPLIITSWIFWCLLMTSKNIFTDQRPCSKWLAESHSSLRVNSSRSINRFSRHQLISPSLVEIMVWHLFSATHSYLNECWLIMKWALGNKFQWHLNGNNIFLKQYNAFENAFFKMAAIVSWPQCVRTTKQPRHLRKPWSPWVLNKQTLWQLMVWCWKDPWHLLFIYLLMSLHWNGRPLIIMLMNTVEPLTWDTPNPQI